MAKTYRGVRVPGKRVDVRVNDVPLHTFREVANHSPDGFNWGYGGSGPAQLSLAILCDLYGADAKEVLFYQKFKDAVVAKFPEMEWVISEDEIRWKMDEIMKGAENGVKTQAIL